MAIPVYKQKCQQRSKGQNAIAKAAYNSCSRLRLEDHEADYRKKSGLVYSALLFAKGERQISRQDFWEKVEASETWKTATVSREGICPLPIELDRDQRQALALDFAQRMIDTYNFAAIDINIHEPKKRKQNATAEENPHAHLQFPDRDRHGKKIRELSRKSELKKIRALWGETVNAHLEAAGLDIRIDMRSLEAQLEEAEAKKAEIDRELADLEKEIAAIEAELKSLEENENGRPDTTGQNYNRAGRTEGHIKESIPPNQSPGGKSKKNRPGQRRNFWRAESNNGHSGRHHERRTGASPEQRHGGDPGLAGGTRNQTPDFRGAITAITTKLRDWQEAIDHRTLHPTTQDRFKKLIDKLQDWQNHIDLKTLRGHHDTDSHGSTQAQVTTPHP